jgi:hypothetical protein
MPLVLSSDLESLSLALLDSMGLASACWPVDVLQNRALVKDVGFTFGRGSAADQAGMIGFRLANPAIREAAGHAANRMPLPRRSGGRIERIWQGIRLNFALRTG